ncbi:MAG: histidinol-phosphate transaminase [Pseudobdellovibrionaceae bacterium]
MKVSSEILSLVPYKPGKPISEAQREYGLQSVIKLASNENPLGPSPKALSAVEKALKNQHLYPDPSCYELVQLVSQKWSISTKNVAIGNGSNEIIDLLIRIFCAPGEAILTSKAAFVAYQVCAQAARVKRFFTPLKPDFTLDLEAMAQFLLENPERGQVRIVFIPNPNNPTGTYVGRDSVEQFLRKVKNVPDLLIVFDEAYNEFVRAQDYSSAQEFMTQFPNVIVIRTFSKAYGLAGFRLGVLLAPEFVIDLFNRVRNPFNVNDLAQVAAVAALSDEDFLRRTQQVTWDGLDQIYQGLNELGLKYVPSQGNFVLFDTQRDVVQVNEALLKRGVILRPVLNYGFQTHMRMSVGTQEENQKALQALREVLKEVKPK